MTKPIGLAAFTQQGTTVKDTKEFSENEPISRNRVRGKREVVALTLRVSRGEWERLHQLAVSEGTSIQSLALEGLSHVFTKKGLPPIER